MFNRLIAASEKDVLSGLTDAKQKSINFAKPAINTIAVPILDIVAVGFLLFFIAGAIRKYRDGQGYTSHIISIIVTLFIIVLISTFPIWGWKMVGV